MQILDGKTLAVQIRGELKNEVEKLAKSGVKPCLAVILVGEDGASATYVANKAKACEHCGIDSRVYKLNENTDQTELLTLIHSLNTDKSVHGVLVQLPLPNHIDKNEILQSIDPRKDVDGFHPLNTGLLAQGNERKLLPCTPLGVITLLKHYNIKVESMDALVIGASNIVGRPMAAMLLNLGASVSICHIKTRDLALYTKNADLIIVAAGCVNLLRADMVKSGVIVIDVGINRVQIAPSENQTHANSENNELSKDENSLSKDKNLTNLSENSTKFSKNKSDGNLAKNYKLVGDVDFENVAKKASFISPVPGGVGPMTIAMLLQNTIKACKNLQNLG